MHHTLAVDLAHHSATPSRQTRDLQPHRVGHIPLHQEAAARTLLAALHSYAFAVVGGVASGHGVGKHGAQGVEVEVKVAVHHRTRLHRTALLVVLGVATLVEFYGVVQVEVQVALGNGGGQYLAVAGVYVAATRGVAAQARLAAFAQGAPLLAVHHLDVEHSHRDGQSHTHREHEVQHHEPPRQTLVLIIMFLFFQYSI